MVTVTPLERADAPALRAIRERPEVIAWWGRQEDDFPFEEPESTRYAIRVDGEVAGMIQYGEENDPDYRHAWIDLFVDPTHHGRGVGTEAIGLVLRVLTEERGHHRVTIDPATDNAAAIRCYEKAGFSPVGVTRRSWRDPDGVWRDSLLMERVTDPR